MKKLNWLGGTALAATLALGTSGCMKDKCTRMVTYTQQIPVYKSYAEIRHDIAAEGPRAIEEAGKIYLYNQYILINDVDKGVHIFELNGGVTTPHSFIPIVGNKDIAVRNGVLFADNYTDLLAIDLSDMRHPSLLKRSEDAFPAMWNDPDNGLLVGYENKTVTEEMDCQQAQWMNGGGPIWMEGDMLATNTAVGATAAGGGSESSGGRGNSTGIGGSMARFTIVDNRLYTVDNMNLHVFDITDPANLAAVSEVNVGWGIETIFPANGYLFIGSSTGMFIYDLDNPNNPQQRCEFRHAEACDPVFVSGNFAYVTLRSGTPCQGTANELNVLDITNINEPVLMRTYPMSNPHGLSVLNDVLYLCEGDSGLKTFDVTDKMAIDQNLFGQVTGFNATDVIASPYQPIVLVIGKDGLSIFDNSDPRNLRLISTIQ